MYLLSVHGIGENVGSTSDEDPMFESPLPRTSKSTKTMEAKCVKIDLPGTITTNRYCWACAASELWKKIPNISAVKVYSHDTGIEVNDLQKLIESLAINCDRNIMDKIADFTLPDEQLYACTGLK